MYIGKAQTNPTAKHHNITVTLPHLPQNRPFPKILQHHLHPASRLRHINPNQVAPHFLKLKAQARDRRQGGLACYKATSRRVDEERQFGAGADGVGGEGA
jgi:hypothetical protein